MSLCFCDPDAAGCFLTSLQTFFSFLFQRETVPLLKRNVCYMCIYACHCNVIWSHYSYVYFLPGGKVDNF